MKLYSNSYDDAIYTLNYYEDKYFISLFAHFKHKAKIYNHCAYTQIIIKKKNFFSSLYIRMSWNSLNLNDKKIKISDFYKNKNKKYLI